MLSKSFFETYLSQVGIHIQDAMKQLESKEFSIQDFTFYTAVSVIASSRIEGDPMEIDSYIKYKTQNIEYLPNLTQKPNDLFKAYEFARASTLNKKNFFKAHKVATKHVLPAKWRGVIRTGNMVIVDQHTNRIQYEAPSAQTVKNEFDSFWKELEELVVAEITTEEVFYFAALIHLVFVKIHPFNDGNGRAGRLLEKWFLASKLGEKAWCIASEYYYYQHITDYYKKLAQVGLFYDELDYQNSLPFLTMLPNSLL